MKRKSNDALQALCRDYLGKLRYMANKHGLGGFVSETIKANSRGECVATEHECQMLARMVDDERISRTDVPKILGKSYRECNDDDDFARIRKLRRVGIYSKVSALLYAATKGKGKKDGTKL